MEHDAAVADRVAGRLGERLDLDPPLEGEPGGLDGRLAARAVADGVRVRALLGDDAALVAHGLDDGGPGLEAVEPPLERAGDGDDGPLVHDREHVEPVPLPDGEVVRVVGRGDLDRAGAELRVDVGVGDDRDAPVGQRQLDPLADEVGVARVVGVDGDGGVTEHRLDAGGGHDDGLVPPLAVLQRDQLAVVVLVIDLDVGDRRQTARAPVDDALGAVDQSVVVEVLEDRLDGLGQALVHGEALARPVQTGTEASQLAEDPAAVLLLPLPGLGDECLTADVVPGLALLGELLLDLVLRGDAAWSMPGSHSVS